MELLPLGGNFQYLDGSLFKIVPTVVWGPVGSMAGEGLDSRIVGVSLPEEDSKVLPTTLLLFPIFANPGALAVRYVLLPTCVKRLPTGSYGIRRAEEDGRTRLPETGVVGSSK